MPAKHQGICLRYCNMQNQSFTVSLKGSQLYTLKPELMPQEKHVLSWLKLMWRSSNPSFLLSEGLAIFLQHPQHPK